MSIPIKCFTCGNVLGDKYRYYLQLVASKKISKGVHTDKIVYLTTENSDKTSEGEVMDEIGLTMMCCRRHMLTHVNTQ